jgi:hypothetical protein
MSGGCAWARFGGLGFFALLAERLLAICRHLALLAEQLFGRLVRSFEIPLRIEKIPECGEYECARCFASQRVNVSR